MRILLTCSQTVQSSTGPQYYESGFVRGEIVNIVIGDGPGDEPLHHFPDLKLVGDPFMKPIDASARRAFEKAGLV